MSNLVLYRWFNQQHELLYVGITRHIGRRIKEHDKGSDWSEQAAYITLERANSIPELQSKEIKAIKEEQPKHNLAHNFALAPEPVMTNELLRSYCLYLKIQNAMLELQILRLNSEIEYYREQIDYLQSDSPKYIPSRIVYKLQAWRGKRKQ